MKSRGQLCLTIGIPIPRSGTESTGAPLPSPPASTDHLHVTGSIVPAVALCLAAATGALAAASGSDPAARAALLLAMVAVASLHASAILRQRRGLERLWPLGWGAIACLATLAPPASAVADSSVSMIAIALGATASICAMIARYFREVDLELAPALAVWWRAAAWFTALSGAALVLRDRVDLDAAIAGLLWGLTAAVGFEGVVRALWTIARRAQVTGPGSWVLTVLFSTADPISSVFVGLHRAIGVDLRHTWALAWVRTAVFPLTLTLGAIGWLATGVSVVEIEEEGVRERLGRPVATGLTPGLHLHLPWPLEVVRRVDVHRVREITIGYDGTRADTSLLWTRQHAAREHALLLGDGRDLVAVNARLQYRPSDAAAWLYTSRNPEDGLTAIAYRALTERTRGATLEGVLSENLADLAVALEDRIRRDSTPLGIEVVGLTLDGLHPPVAVAERYQAVVAAQVDRETQIIEAAAYRAAAIPQAEAEAVHLVALARAEHAARLADASGEAGAFLAIAVAQRGAPGSFRLRRRLETVEDGLSNKPLVVIDSRFERDGGVLWVNE